LCLYALPERTGLPEILKDGSTSPMNDEHGTPLPPRRYTRWLRSDIEFPGKAVLQCAVNALCESIIYANDAGIKLW
jgi:hypothetical protein